MTLYDADALGELLEQAAALPRHARASYVDKACLGDNNLRETIESLLVAHDAASGYFECLQAQVIRPAFVGFANDVAEDATTVIDEFSIGQIVAHYQLLERVGSGGMGVVFKARDLRLDRFVALKFLPAHLGKDLRAKERLVAEAKTASALDHPNIAVVHDIGETDQGRLFIVMAYYEGETLQLKIKRVGLSVAGALDVARQIANALSAAHRKGIIHRDVKPSNVLVTPDGTAKLLDFGIAKLAASTPTRETVAAGTVAYMSPEQTRAVTVDRRTDLWSLGVVLYEMLAGRRPFRAETEEALVFAIRHSEWQPLDSLTGDSPEGISRILERCLAKDPDGRYGEAEELLADLRKVGSRQALESSLDSNDARRLRLLRYGSVAALLTVTVVVGTSVGRRADSVTGPLPGAELQSPRNRLAILPIMTEGSDTDESYIADGLTEELIARFSRVVGLSVIARSSLMGFKGSGNSAREIGRELSVGALLTGSLRETTGQMQMTLQLVDANSQETLWTRNYTATLADLNSVQHDIVRRIIAVLGVQGQHAGRPELSQDGAASREAYVLYLKGRRLLEKRNVEAANQARDHFEQALDLDPAFAKAWVGLGDAFSGLNALGTLRSADAYARSSAAARRALQIDPNLAEAHVCLATALSQYYWDFATAAHHYRRALELNPSSADAHRLYAEHLRYEGRFDEALREARTSEALDPLSSAPQIVAGTILYWSRQYDAAVREFRRIIEVNPRFSYSYFFLALAHIQKQEYDQALEALEVPGAGSELQQFMLKGYVNALSGRHAEARQVVAELHRLLRTKNISPWHPAIVHVALGEHDRAIDLLEQAYLARDWQLRMLPVEPLLDALRSHPRFRALADKMLPQPR